MFEVMLIMFAIIGAAVNAWYVLCSKLIKLDKKYSIKYPGLYDD